jgi:hypothetical protein
MFAPSLSLIVPPGAPMPKRPAVGPATATKVVRVPPGGLDPGAPPIGWDGAGRVSDIAHDLLQNALRNARAPQRLGDTTFGLADGRLMFFAAGAGPPFDPDYDWRITVQGDAGGLELVGTPAGRGPDARVAIRVPGVTRCDVQVLATKQSKWVSEWPPTTDMPRAVAVTLLHQDAPVGGARFSVAFSDLNARLDLNRGDSRALRALFGQFTTRSRADVIVAALRSQPLGRMRPPVIELMES